MSGIWEWMDRTFTPESGIFAQPSTSAEKSARAETSQNKATEATNIAAKAAEDAQSLSDMKAESSEMKKRRALARSRSIYTSPIGIGQQANTVRKTLTGQ